MIVVLAVRITTQVFRSDWIRWEDPVACPSFSVMSCSLLRSVTACDQRNVLISSLFLLPIGAYMCRNVHSGLSLCPTLSSTSLLIDKLLEFRLMRITLKLPNFLEIYFCVWVIATFSERPTSNRWHAYKWLTNWCIVWDINLIWQMNSTVESIAASVIINFFVK